MGLCFSCFPKGDDGQQQQQEQANGWAQPPHAPYTPPIPAPSPVAHNSASPPPKAAQDYEAVLLLWRDLDHFGKTRALPAGLAQAVKAHSPKTHTGWFERLLAAWNEAPERPATTEEAAKLVREGLRGIRQENLRGVLSFYGLPLDVHVAPWEMGHKYEFTTLPVDGRACPDGDTMTVAVDTAKDAREGQVVPPNVREAFVRRTEARNRRDYATADSLRAAIKTAGYLVLDHPVPTLARQYRIRFRGIDAPESDQAYGPESGALLRKTVEGKPVRCMVHTEDRYGRVVADIWCGDVWLQELMLREGAAWHYKDFDSDPLLAKWEVNARQARKGLWKDPSALEPWDFRKNKRNGGQSHYT